MTSLGRLLTPGLAVAAAAAVVLARPAQAQDDRPPPITVEVHGGVSLPSGSFQSIAKTAPDYGIAARYSFAPFFGVYGGYDARNFALKGLTPEGFTQKLNDQGLRVGVQLVVPSLGRVPIQPFVEGGLLLNTAKYQTTHKEGSGINQVSVTGTTTSNFGAGYEFGGGLAVPVIHNFSLVPEVRYRSYKPSWDPTQPGPTPQMSALSLDLGVRFHW